MESILTKMLFFTAIILNIVLFQLILQKINFKVYNAAMNFSIFAIIGLFVFLYVSVGHSIAKEMSFDSHKEIVYKCCECEHKEKVIESKYEE